MCSLVHGRAPRDSLLSPSRGRAQSTRGGNGGRGWYRAEPNWVIGDAAACACACTARPAPGACVRGGGSSVCVVCHQRVGKRWSPLRPVAAYLYLPVAQWPVAALPVLVCGKYIFICVYVSPYPYLSYSYQYHTTYNSHRKS